MNNKTYKSAITAKKKYYNSHLSTKEDQQRKSVYMGGTPDYHKGKPHKITPENNPWLNPSPPKINKNLPKGKKKNYKTTNPEFTPAKG